MDVEAEKIARLLGQMNAAWVELGGERLADRLRVYLHEQVTICGPDLTVLAGGRDACVASYVDFVARATIQHAEFGTPEISTWGTTATASQTWHLIYAIGEQQHDETGRELFIFERDDAGWRAVSRIVLA